MIIYNQAFDLYHTIFRILHILNKLPNDNFVELNRIRIWDFYLLFPNEIHNISLKRDESNLKEIRKKIYPKSKNPYEIITSSKKIFEKIEFYQITALHCIASYGIIDKNILSQDKISISSRKILNKYIDFINESLPLTLEDDKIISFFISNFLDISLQGKNGLNARSKLIESKYDA